MSRSERDEARREGETGPRFSALDVMRYYDRNTPAFVALGQGGAVGAIRRAVWQPGVADRKAAFHAVDERIALLVARLARDVPEPHVVDLGCGVGASLCHLAARLPIRGTGVTLSRVQAALAAERAKLTGLGDRLEFVAADYSALPPLARADLAMAIESFVHAPSAAAFFAQCRALVRPGGLLAICDDFERASAAAAAGAAAAIDRFRRGWHVNSLLDAAGLHALATAHGFAHVETTDLTAYLELDRPRDRAVNLLLKLFGRLPLERTRFGHLLGGSALQECLKRGWIGYDLAVFRRTDEGLGANGP